MSNSLPPQYFDDIYSKNIDPWDFETSPYEAEKYATTVAALPRPRYSRALEIGCSIGVLTAQLATKCESLLSLDVSDLALDVARHRCQSLPQVTFANRSIPADFPDGLFDLIIVSEVAYFWSLEDFAQAKNQIALHQSSDAHLLLVHWTPKVEDYPQTGDAVHDSWLADPRYSHLHAHRHEKYRLDLLQKRA